MINFRAIRKGGSFLFDYVRVHGHALTVVAGFGLFSILIKYVILHFYVMMQMKFQKKYRFQTLYLV